MKNSNQVSEVRSISNLSLNGSYFSRSMNVNFTVVGIDKVDKKLKLGIGKDLKEVNFLKFNRAYLREGLIVN